MLHQSRSSHLVAVERGEAPVVENLGLRLRPQPVHLGRQVQEYTLLGAGGVLSEFLAPECFFQ